MPALARTDLESLLRARKLDGTLASAPLYRNADEVAPSGVAELDAQLGGGWPRGQVSEVVGARSSGRSLVAVTSLGAATRRGELAALVDTVDTFDSESAAASGPLWSHLLWIRGRPLAHTRIGSGRGGNRPGLDLLGTALDRALKAVALVLSAGGFGLVVLDLADVPAQVVQRLPFTTWLRLQRLVEGRQTACVIIASEPLGRSTGGITLKLAPTGEVAGRWQGTGDRSRLLAGVEARGCIVRARFSREAAETFTLAGAGIRG